MNTLIVTPMQNELDFILKGCVRRGFHAEDSMAGRLPIVKLAELNLVLARGGTGKAQFALQTQHLLDAQEWKLVICAGAGGALVDALSVGDVVVATETVEHDYNNKFNLNPVPSFRGTPDVIADLRRLPAFGKLFNLHFGTVASGDEDIVDSERRAALRKATGALAVAWEGAGGARACKFSNVPYLEMRGITDIAGPDSPADFLKNLQTAMDHIAEVITRWITGPSTHGQPSK